jgi:Mg-chelatase subunit ChlD
VVKLFGEKVKIKGFAISIDALFATLLVIGALALIGIETQTTDIRVVSTSLNIKQVADDAFASLDNSGTLEKYLANPQLSPLTLLNPPNPGSPGIYYEALRLLPENSGLKIVITEYLAADDLTQCKLTGSFDDCFGAPIAAESFPTGAVPDKRTISGRRILVTKESPLGQDVAGGRECVPGQLIANAAEKEEFEKWMLQAAPALDIETWIGITDKGGSVLNQTNPLVCYENGSQANETAKVTIKARNSSRDPVAIAMALDRSGSMDTYDVITQQATGTFQGGVCENEEVWVPAKEPGFGNALKFNGFTSYVDCGLNNAFNSDDELTIAMWVKIEDPNENAWRRLIGKESGLYFREGYVLRYHALNNQLQFYGNGNNQAEAINVDLGTGWHHIAVVVNGTTGIIYLDNVDVTTDSAMDQLANNTKNFYIGNAEPNLSNGDYFKGTMDDIWLFDRALTPGEVGLIYADDDAPVSANLIAHWKFDETSLFLASDASGNGRYCVLRRWSHVQDWNPPDIRDCETQPGEPGFTLDTCPANKLDFVGHTNSQKVATYDLDPIYSLINKYPNPSDSLTFNATSTSYAGECGGGRADYMRLWLEIPDGSSNIDGDYIGNYNIESVYNPPNGVYGLHVWSDYLVNYHIKLRQTINSAIDDNVFGGGTHDGIYAPPEQQCSNYGNWQLLRAIKIDATEYDAIYSARWFIGYDAYRSAGGQCQTPRFEARRNSDGSLIAASGNCGNGDWGNCNFFVINSGFGGPYLTSDTYELWGWSDIDLTVDVDFQAYQNWGAIYGSSYDKVIDGGTCNGVACSKINIPASTDYTNCPNSPIDKSMDRLIAQNKQSLDTFAVASDLSGLKASVDFDYTTPNTAICHAAMNYKHAANSYNDSWYYIFSDNVTSSSVSFTPNNANPKDLYINDWPPTTLSYWTWASGPPIAQGDYEIQGWAEEEVSYNINWMLKRIDASKIAAKDFIDNAGWQFEDEIALVSFSSTPTLDQSLIGDQLTVKNAIDAMVAPNGETGIAEAIDEATDHLVNNARSDAGRFLILLTDGRANICRGGSSCSEAAAIADAIDAANDARAQEVTIYVIGFADASLIGSYEADLNVIAQDKDDARFKAECASGSLQYCGKYYYAPDAQTLQEMYALIALDIITMISNTNIELPVPNGMQLTNYGSGTCGTWDDSTGGFTDTIGCSGQCSGGGSTCFPGEILSYKDRAIGGFGSNTWWAAQYDAVMPCNGSNCSNSFVLFPPTSTDIMEISSGNVANWDGIDDQVQECGPGQDTKCHKRIPFEYADLNVAFTYGLLRTGDDIVLLDLEIGNDGNKNVGIKRTPIIDGLQISFYKTNHSNKVNINEIGTTEYWLGNPGQEPAVQYSRAISDNNLYVSPENAILPDDVCSWKEGNCIGPTYQDSWWKIRIEDIELTGCPNNNCEGTIIAEINQNQKVGECPLHNTAQLFCGRDRLRFFTIDYFVWDDTNPTGSTCLISIDCDDADSCTADICSGSPRTCSNTPIAMCCGNLTCEFGEECSGDCGTETFCADNADNDQANGMDCADPACIGDPACP